MCSLNDGDINEVEELMVKEPSLPCNVSGMCRKCNEKTAVVVLRIRDPYCRECFLLSTVHKFRALLGKSKIMRPSDRVLIGYSGGQSSTCLLHLLRNGMNETTHKRILFTSLVLYIDEGAALGHSQKDRQVFHSSIADSLSKFGFPAYHSTLDKSINDNTQLESVCLNFDNSPMTFNEESDKYLQNIVGATNNLTSREDLMEKLRMKLLLSAAKELNCTKVFVADTGNNLAVKILSNIALGRGAQLPLDVGFCDTRDPDVKVLRPIRDFTKKEVAFYNKFNELQEVFIPSIGTKSSSDSSIQKLTEKFVTDLQAEFPSTVSNVFRTGDKLSLSADVPLAEESCILCNAPLDTARMESSALQATEFSRKISNLGPAGFDSSSLGSLGEPRPEVALTSPQINCCSTQGCKCSRGDTALDSAQGGCCATEAQGCKCSRGASRDEHRITWTEAEDFICYGCRLITREIEKSVQHLPPQLAIAIQERTSFKKMREEIQDFLL